MSQDKSILKHVRNYVIAKLNFRHRVSMLSIDQHNKSYTYICIEQCQIMVCHTYFVSEQDPRLD